MVFIRYPEHSKRYVMFGEHQNGRMTEIDSSNVVFFEDEFPSVGEINQDLQLYELRLNPGLSLGKGGNVVPQQLTEDRTHMLQREVENLSYQRINLDDRFRQGRIKF